VRAQAFTELVPLPRRGRVFASAARAGLADCAPSGRIRLDALARWLQDIAYEDVEDAGVAGAAVWVVRRTRISVARFPRFGERFSLKTFCSGFGRAWAERRTSITSPHQADAGVEAVSLWVHLDPASRRPAPLTLEEIQIYGEAAAGRKVTARLRHQSPDGTTEARRWTFRATECDVAGHVNNAAYWTVVEEDVTLEVATPVVAEVEHRGAARAGDALVRTGEGRWWICSATGETHASIRLTITS
jgi:acyl-ACP thioesterase